MRLAILLALACALAFTPSALAQSPRGDEGYWWQGYPSFAATGNADAFARTGARMALQGYCSDPTWGAYARRLTELDSQAEYQKFKAQDARVIAWIEGFGDCMLYALSLDRKPDGSFAMRGDDPRLTAGQRSHWSWAVASIPQGNTFRWVGVHNTTNDEDFVMPLFGLEATGLPVPTYPDGTPAVGWIEGAAYPLNAKVYDACGSKDINGKLSPAFEAPSKVNEKDENGQRRGPVEGLVPAVPGKDDVGAVPGLAPGEPVYCGVISVHKDLSAPFWREYGRASVRRMAEVGLDGAWVDNYSPWDNFCAWPVRRAFGDWSVALFRQYLAQPELGDRLAALGIADPASFDVRAGLKARAASLGARDTSNCDDPTWSSPRWLDDPLWGAYRAYRQGRAQTDLKAYYDALHQAATEAGKPDFCLGGNDIPFFGLGWVRDGWLDMVNTEVTPGWHPGTGSRGLLLPPDGKMGVVYRVAREHQKGPFCGAWYYLDGTRELQDSEALGRLLLTEAFANGAFLMADTDNPRLPGTSETHAWWNGFVRSVEGELGRRDPRADVGLVFSPDSQFCSLAPGGFPDMDRQPHVFGHWGWAEALIDAHVPYRVVTDWRLPDLQPGDPKTLILPDVDCLEDVATQALGRWVEAGGRLVVTGATGSRWAASGWFQKRPQGALRQVLGEAVPSEMPTRRTAVRVGQGEVIWEPENVGMQYYLDVPGRPAALENLLSLTGTTDLSNAAGLPDRVGLFTWQGRDGGAIFADLVNYNYDRTTDQTTPAQDLSFALRLPEGWTGASVKLLSPDGSTGLTSEVRDGWVRVGLGRLEQYVCVKVAKAE
jgi:hypothetical protein